MVKYSTGRSRWNRLKAAALGGLIAGTTLSGCTGDTTAPAGGSAAKSGSASSTVEASVNSTDMHACKGLNGCETHGAGGKNACAGQGGCATAAMHHECKGQNACKGQGGGETAGMNACKGQGGCAVPIKDENAWKKAREAFETKMKAENKKIGQAPA